ncbi:uncharacterized membrane protein YjjB (DUF3815 family) [Natranaerovirga pectinivora]|uniref:Uncharacterized membrane protein YjjB (DUF3815 family) n=1 Tax=Natranaerovirga pectinivora TaxID=682400 RepID=A0A4R3MNH3_9FIRM|nr:threonine/serine exporter family protein [Natranaerovirga pectinivora]TCT16797.1 uncharacterized membrane protein YjjB (DUF3815 family) [Natranaerovirga pectinivora]
MIVQVVSAFFATYFFAIIFNISKKHLIPCGITGAIGWGVYFICMNFSLTVVVSSFFGALTVAFTAHILAKKKKTPVTVFLISGIIPLVPGAGMYRTVFYIITDDFTMSTQYGLETLQIAGVIAIAIILLDTFNKIIVVKR